MKNLRSTQAGGVAKYLQSSIQKRKLEYEDADGDDC